MPTAVTQQTAVEIPLRLIHSNPDNPRPFVSQDMVDDLAANIQEVGLNNPIKVVVDKAQSVGPGGETNYVNLSGEIRFRAFQKLGRETIPAFVLDLTPEEAATLAYLENRRQDMGWWGDYRAVENLLKANPNLTYRQVAVRLQMNKDKVNRAVGLLPLLNPKARGLLVSNGDKDNKGNWQIAERAAARLAELGPSIPSQADDGDNKAGDRFKPATPEIQDLVCRGLEAAQDRQMTEAQVKRLVEWVKGGKNPEDFDPAKVSNAKPVEQSSNYKDNQQHGHEISQNPEVGEPKDSKPKSVLQSPTPTIHAQIGSLIAGKELAKKLHIPAHSLNTLLPSFARHFQQVISLFERLGVKNKVYATALALFLVIFVGSTLIGWSNRLMGWLVNSLVYRPVVSQRHLANPNPVQVVPSNPTHSAPAVVREPKPNLASAARASIAVNPPASAQVPAKPAVSTAPATQSVQKKENPLKAVGDAVHGVSDAVNTANQGAQAVDTAKKLLGF